MQKRQKEQVFIAVVRIWFIPSLLVFLLTLRQEEACLLMGRSEVSLRHKNGLVFSLYLLLCPNIFGVHHKVIEGFLNAWGGGGGAKIL